MGKQKGRYLPISPFRHLVTDLMHFSQQVPTVTAERKMNLRPLIEAREAAFPRPSWTSIFTKAFAIVSKAHPELRRSYLRFPWPRFYEHGSSIATVNVERIVNNESVILYCHISRPEARGLVEIDQVIRHHKEDPIEQVRSYQRAMSLSRWPRFLRRLAWRGALNLFGSLRCHNFGTFGISTVAGQGAGLLKLLPILTATVFYGLFDKEGGLEVRLAWDHRVFDGALAARVLVNLEETLNGPMLQEIRSITQRAA